MKHSVYLVTTNTLESAKMISETLLSKRLIACANLVTGNSPVLSIYTWKGKVENDPEYLMVMKSKTNLLNEIVEEVKKVHPYDVPEIISFGINGSKEYLDWIDESTKEPKENEEKEL